MSRSIVTRKNKKAVIIKLWGGNSDKKDKQAANRSFRRQNRMDAKLSTLNEEDDFKHHSIKDVSDTWSFRSDGLSNYLNIYDYDKEKYNKFKSK